VEMEPTFFKRAQTWLRGLGLSLRGHAFWWFQVCIAAIKRFDQHDADTRAAAISYFGLMSIFPIVLLLIIVASFFFESKLAQEQVIAFVEKNIPTSQDVIRGNVEQVLRYRGPIGLVALLGLLWSALGVFGTIDRALNRIWDVSVLRPFWRSKLLAILVIIGIGVLSLASFATTAIVSFTRHAILPFLASRWAITLGPWDLIVWSMPYVSSIFLFMFIYWIFPHAEVGWRDVLPGAVLAGIIWEEAKLLFTDYVTLFGRYNLVYGSLGTIIGMLVWFYFSAIILLAGAEVSAAYTRARKQALP